jgi:hypothetical protein
MGTGQRIVTIFVILIAICLLCAGSGYIGFTHSQHIAQIEQTSLDYQQGQNSGEKIGYDRGYQEGYQAGINEGATGYNLHDPSYQEVLDFLAKDHSEDVPYNKENHICTDYTTDVNNNAEKAGLRCGSVYIIYPETGHSIIAFDTTDKGLIFIEPQYDKEVKLPVGKSYSVSNGFYNPDNIDDTIVRYLIMW